MNKLSVFTKIFTLATMLVILTTSKSVIVPGTALADSPNVCPAQSFDTTVNTVITAAPNKADIVFAFDTTGSMRSVLDDAKDEASEIMNEISRLIPDSQFAVVDFRDYPSYSYMGESSDWPYRLRQSITSNRWLIQKAIDATYHGGGKDLPESYSRALYESYGDANLGWRPDARRFVVMFGDNTPRDNNLNQGVPNPPSNPGKVWCNGRCTLDPGRDGRLNTADDLDLQTVLQDMADQDITLLFVYSGRSSDVRYYWNHWASLTAAGGQAVSLNSAGGLTGAIVDLVTSASQKIGRLTLQTEPTRYQSWLSFTDKTNLTIPSRGLNAQFAVRITPPVGTRHGDYNFTIKVVGDGAVYSTQNIQLSIPTACSAASLTLSPKTATSAVNTQQCVVATVKDRYSRLLADVPITFNVTGENRTTGSSRTNTAGEAEFCYTGTAMGNDSLVATVNGLVDTAQITWTGAQADVMIKDNAADDGTEPSPGIHWASRSIWVRHQADGETNGNSESLQLGETVHLYAEVINNGDVVMENVTAEFYWVGNNLAPSWHSWNLIGSTNVGRIEIGEQQIISLPWNVPAFLNGSHHACLQVRLISDQDPITTLSVRGSNNIAQRNVHIIRSCDNPGNISTVDDEMVFNISNPFTDTAKSIDLSINREYFHRTGLVEITFEETLFAKWQAAGGTVEGGHVDGSGKIIMTTTGQGFIRGLPLEAGEQVSATLHLKAAANDYFSVAISEIIDGDYLGGNVYTAGCGPDDTPPQQVDIGFPDDETGVYWASPNIWVRQQADDKLNSEPLLLDKTVYLYSRIRNRGDLEIPKIRADFYWNGGLAGSNLAPAWKDWQFIGSTELLNLEVGAEQLIHVPWHVPALLNGSHHACLQVRLTTEKDADDTNSVKNNNNIAQRNVHILRSCDNPGNIGTVDDTVEWVINNPTDTTQTVELAINREYFHAAGLIEIFLEETYFESWLANGGTVEGGIIDETTKKITINSAGMAFIRGLTLEAEQDVPATMRIKAATDAYFSVAISQIMNGEYVGGNIYTAGCAPGETPNTEEPTPDPTPDPKPEPVILNVKGTSPIFIAGRDDVIIPDLGETHPSFPLRRHGFVRPDFLVETRPTMISVEAGDTMAFKVTGAVDYWNGTGNSYPPDGDGLSGSNLAGLAGVSGFQGPRGPLVAVFLNDENPAGKTTPMPLDFTPAGIGTSFAELTPKLGQVFFIGDGLTGQGSGDRQLFNVPEGATRLFFGVADGFGFGGHPGAYEDNDGAFHVEILTLSAAPDIMVRDNPQDDGSVPSRGPHWISPDIWSRHAPDNGKTAQSLQIGETNYFYINLRNLGGQSIGDVKAILYIANPSVGLSWPGDWQEIGSVDVGTVLAREEKTVMISADVPAHLIAGDHACTLVRLVSDTDPITNDGYVRGDNNIAQRNMHILRECDNPGDLANVDGTYSFWIHNPSETTAQTVDLEISRDRFHAAGTVELFLGDDLFAAWQEAGGTVAGATVDVTTKKIVITANTGHIRGIPLEAATEVEAKLHLTSATNTYFSVGVSELIDGEYVGGSVYEAGCAPNKLTIIKEANVNGNYHFGGDFGNFILANNGMTTFEKSTHGTYAVTEDPTQFPGPYMSLISVSCRDESGWRIDSVDIDYDQFITRIGLLPGQHLTCTFLNEAADYTSTGIPAVQGIFLPIVVR